MMHNFFDVPPEGSKPAPPPGPPPGGRRQVRDPLDAESFKAQLFAFRPDMEKMVAEIKRFEVKDEASNEKAAAMIGAVKKLYKAVEAERKGITKRAREFVSAINAAAKTITGPLGDAERHLRQALSQYAYKLEQERRRREAELRRKMAEEQRRLEEQAKQEGFQPVKLPEQHVPVRRQNVRTETSTVSTKMEWTFQVEDKSKLPVEYILPDERKIKAAIDAGIREIPGVRIYEKPKVRVRTK